MAEEMDIREKLVEIIQNSVGGCARNWAEIIADGLIDHGVTLGKVPRAAPDLTGKCGSCIYAEKVEAVFGSSATCVRCKNPGLEARRKHEVSGIKQRTSSACKRYAPRPAKHLRCKYLGSGPLEGRCMATKDTEPCVGPGACTVYKPARTKLGGDVLLEALVVFESAQQAAERRGEEAFTCPLCGGKAWWSRATLNGHPHCGCDGCHFELRE